MGTSRHLRLPRRTSHDEVKVYQLHDNQEFPLKSLKRAASALARHKPHQLSEIREVSDSYTTSIQGRPTSRLEYTLDGTTEPLQDGESSEQPVINDIPTISDPENLIRFQFRKHSTNPSDLRSLAPSALSLPLHDIPQRKSSITALNPMSFGSHAASFEDLRAKSGNGQEMVHIQGRAESPVRTALEQGAQSSDALRSSPSRTFIRTTMPFYLLENNRTRNPRLDMSLRLPSSLFVGGGTVEGQIEIKIDAHSSKKIQAQEMFISRLSVDIIGVEEVEDGRRRIFLCLATELFDSQHPPPSTMVVSQTPENGSELYWKTRQSTTTLPFCVNLPLKLGPPPYSSRQASIRYLLCPSVIIKIGEKRLAVRQAWSIQMLTIHDPEKALSSLSSPLLATDTLMLSHKPVNRSVKLTAGLHRQTWVSGGAIFTDIHIINNTDKMLKRIDLELEKSILWFAHSAAGTTEKRANNLRLPAKIDTDTVWKTTIRKSKEWEGIVQQASEVRTCEILIPRGHATIGDGRYFEVRYFVKVSVVVSRFKIVSVQLPVTVIHINSLDVVPNSLAQVAASIEAKRSVAISRTETGTSHQPHSQGQAFTAALQESLRRAKHPPGSTVLEDVSSLTHDVDNSPRRTKRVGVGTLDSTMPGQAKGKDEKDENTRPGSSNCHLHAALRSTCYHCHLLHLEHATRTTMNSGPKLPRLQVSTSGLGFSESEFEIPPDLPRKVMLSERDRQMIKQQRELRLQREWSQQKNRNGRQNQQTSNPRPNFVGWKNVALVSDPRSVPSDMYRSDSRPSARKSGQRVAAGTHMQRLSLPPSMPGRRRSRTVPESSSRHSHGDAGPAEMRPSQPVNRLRRVEPGGRHSWSGHDLTDSDVFGLDSKTSKSGESSERQVHA